MSQLMGSPPGAYPRRTDDAAVPAHGDHAKPLQEAGMTTRTSLWRKLGARASLLTSLAGMTIILTSVIFFFVEDDFRRILGVTAGLFCLLLAIRYAAHPFLKEERHYLDLRRDTQVLLDLTRELHYAAVRGDEAAFESIKEKLPAQVEMVIATARKSEAVHATSGE